VSLHSNVPCTGSAPTASRPTARRVPRRSSPRSPLGGSSQIVSFLELVNIAVCGSLAGRLDRGPIDSSLDVRLAGASLSTRERWRFFLRETRQQRPRSTPVPPPHCHRRAKRAASGELQLPRSLPGLALPQTCCGYRRFVDNCYCPRSSVAYFMRCINQSFIVRTVSPSEDSSHEGGPTLGPVTPSVPSLLGTRRPSTLRRR
jgi:hypothetical protein